jgi:large subunit ribosomal protein L31
MKEKIHPTYYPDALVVCACGNSWHTGSTKKEIRTDVCFKCHPFYTGEQRIVDTEGQVDRFYRKLQARQQYKDEAKHAPLPGHHPTVPFKNWSWAPGQPMPW